MLGGAAVVGPLAAEAQPPAVPVIGFLGSLSSSYAEHFAPAVRRGLNETGYVEGQNVAIEYRLAEGQYDRLPRLAADLVDRKVAVIFAVGGSDPAKAAKAVTVTIPIVFVSAADPIKAGIITSLNRPGGNITGVSLLGSALEAKRLGLLHEIIPGVTPIGVLVNPKYPDVDIQLRELQEAASAIKRQINVARASTESEIDTAFATVVQQGAGALLVAQDPFFGSRHDQLVALAARYKLPAIYYQRQIRRNRRSCELRHRLCGTVSPRWNLCRKSSQRCQTSRFASHSTDQARVGHQPQDRKGAQPHHSAGHPLHCRSGDRIRTLFAAAHFVCVWP
jgi:putative tryptophan/tyrosine transport system substrate-binding protein